MSSTPARARSRIVSHTPLTMPRRRNQAAPNAIPEMPEYEPPSVSLGPEAQRYLLQLLKSRELSDVKVQLQHAAEGLGNSAGKMTEKITDAQVKHEREKNKRVANGEQEDDIESNEELSEREKKLNAINERLDEEVRKIVDGSTRLEELENAIKTIAGEEAATHASVVTSSEPRRTRSSRQQQLDEEDADEDEEVDPYRETTPEREARESITENPPIKRFDKMLEEHTQEWNQLSLTERYAKHNSYVDFYRFMHNAKFPGEEKPPLPHSSKWFEHLEDTSAISRVQSRTSAGQSRSTRSRREPSPADSDDIAIATERISLKCPLTLLPFSDPVTSTKCPHSFEREAIHAMINQSTMTIPGPPVPGSGGRNQRVHAVKCPVCSVPLSIGDLRPDPVLLQQVHQAAEREARRAEEEQSDEESEDQPSNRVTLASDAVDADDMDIDVEIEEDSDIAIKPEPATQQIRESESRPESDPNSTDSDSTSEDSEGSR